MSDQLCRCGHVDGDHERDDCHGGRGFSTPCDCGMFQPREAPEGLRVWPGPVPPGSARIRIRSNGVLADTRVTVVLANGCELDIDGAREVEWSIRPSGDLATCRVGVAVADVAIETDARRLEIIAARRECDDR